MGEEGRATFQNFLSPVGSGQRKLCFALVQRILMTLILVGAGILTTVFIGSCGANPASPTPVVTNSPTVTPATGGHGVPITIGTFNDVDAIGYETAEFFISNSS